MFQRISLCLGEHDSWSAGSLYYIYFQLELSAIKVLLFTKINLIVYVIIKHYELLLRLSGKVNNTTFTVWPLVYY